MILTKKQINFDFRIKANTSPKGGNAKDNKT